MSKSAVLRRLQKSLENGKDTAKQDAVIAQFIQDFASDPNFYLLPLNVIFRIASKCHQMDINTMSQLISGTVNSYGHQGFEISDYLPDVPIAPVSTKMRKMVRVQSTPSVPDLLVSSQTQKQNYSNHHSKDDQHKQSQNLIKPKRTPSVGSRVVNAYEVAQNAAAENEKGKENEAITEKEKEMKKDSNSPQKKKVRKIKRDRSKRRVSEKEKTENKEDEKEQNQETNEQEAKENNKPKRDDYENDPFVAVEKGDLESIQHLAEVDPQSLSVKDSDGNTLLHIAAKYAKDDIIEYLLDNGICDIESKNNKRWTPIHMACSSNCLSTVELLVSNGASVEPYGRDSPLHIAVYNDNIDIAEFLINNGADLKKRGFYLGFVPLGYAKSQKMIQLLTEYAE